MANADLSKRASNALMIIERSNNPKDLERIAVNALRQGEHAVRHAALMRLYAISPAAKPGTLEYDVWRSIYALEGALKDERGKTVRLSRTRQKIKRDGEHRTVSDLVIGKVSDGFRMLLDRAMPELTFEAVALRHAHAFDDEVLTAARTRLKDAGISLDDGNR